MSACIRKGSRHLYQRKNYTHINGIIYTSLLTDFLYLFHHLVYIKESIIFDLGKVTGNPIYFSSPDSFKFDFFLHITYHAACSQSFSEKWLIDRANDEICVEIIRIDVMCEVKLSIPSYSGIWFCDPIWKYMFIHLNCSLLILNDKLSNNKILA